MNIDEKLILTAWSKGLAGAGTRLAKRAWWVLQDSERRSPAEMVGAWTNASEAQEWVIKFHSMGVVGLMDTPRAGRPTVHADSVEYVQERFQDLALEGVKARKQRIELLRGLSQQEKESLWRAARRTGTSLMRNRNGLDISIPVPAGIRDLLCVHLGTGVKVFAFLPESHKHLDQLNGLWLGVPKLKLFVDGNRPKRLDLISALSTEISLTSASEYQERQEKKIQKKLIHHEERVLDHIMQFAQTYPGRITLNVLVDLSDGPNLIRVLGRLRSRWLWSTGVGRYPGNLKVLRVIPFNKAWATSAQMSLAANLSDAVANQLADLQDHLTLKRKNGFSWIRTADVEEAESNSTWLKHEVGDPDD